MDCPSAAFFFNVQPHFDETEMARQCRNQSNKVIVDFFFTFSNIRGRQRQPSFVERLLRRPPVGGQVRVRPPDRRRRSSGQLVRIGGGGGCRGGPEVAFQRRPGRRCGRQRPPTAVSNATTPSGPVQQQRDSSWWKQLVSCRQVWGSRPL